MRVLKKKLGIICGEFVINIPETSIGACHHPEFVKLCRCDLNNPVDAFVKFKRLPGSLIFVMLLQV